ncbi:MAG: hypothetical protein HQ513_12145 [Rhodospirillales bacterium]|nr:hypothetical protein [Rhodospirillales bacterium]
MGSSVSYEVMGFKDGHWSILFITDDREEAVSEAKNAEAGKHIQAVKVVQESADDDTGEERSKTIYSGGLQEGAAGSHAHKYKVAPNSQGGGGAGGSGGAGMEKQKLHPELVTDFIDRIRSSVIVIGVVFLVLFILGIAYLSNPDAVSGLIDGFLN